MGLEAALLNKFMAPAVLQRGREKKKTKKKEETTGSWSQMLWHEVDIAYFIAMSELPW